MSKKCSVEGCDRRHWAKGYCERHYSRVKKYGDPLYLKYPLLSRVTQIPVCSVEGCTRQHYGNGLCGMHHRRLREWGHTGPPEKIRRAKGDGHIDKNGYHLITVENGVTVRKHVWLAEKALGKPLPKDAQVHHVDCNKSNNDPRNLVVCPDQAYHSLIELRTKAYEACGNANWIRCRHCKQYDDPKNMRVYKNEAFRGSHHECQKLHWESQRQK